ncbi:hypothetical protein Tco_1370468 [Tanacetum coccineum]
MGSMFPTGQILDSRVSYLPKLCCRIFIAMPRNGLILRKKWHNGTSSRTRSTETSDGLAAIQSQLNNLGRKIKKVNEKVYAAQSSRARILPAKRHEENSNIIKEIRASTDAAIRNQGESIKSLELQIRQMSKVLQEIGFGSLPSSTATNPKDQVKSISTATADLSEIRRMEISPYAVSVPQHRYIFPEIVPFLRQLHNYCCDDLKEAHEVKILDAIDHNLP